MNEYFSENYVVADVQGEMYRTRTPGGTLIASRYREMKIAIDVTILKYCKCSKRRQCLAPTHFLSPILHVDVYKILRLIVYYEPAGFDMSLTKVV